MYLYREITMYSLLSNQHFTLPACTVQKLRGEFATFEEMGQWSHSHFAHFTAHNMLITRRASAYGRNDGRRHLAYYNLTINGPITHDNLASITVLNTVSFLSAWFI